MIRTLLSSLLLLLAIAPAFSGKTLNSAETPLAKLTAHNPSIVEIANAEGQQKGKTGDDDPIVPPNYY